MLKSAKDLAHLKLYRLTYEYENHNGFQYQDGLNVDTLPFDPSGECRPGGLYCFDETNIIYFAQYTQDIKWIREVTLLEDSQIYQEKHKYKADKFFLGPRTDFSDWLSHQPEICLRAVKIYGLALQYVKEQTLEMCLAAVQQNGRALKYVKMQTPEICLAAVQQNGYALQYVEKQTLDICLAAVQQYGYALEYVTEQTHDICLAAVQQYGLALRHVKEQTPEICLAAVQQDGYAFRLVKKQTLEICLAASSKMDVLKDLFL